MLALALAPARADATTSADVKRAMTALSGGAGAYAWNITDGRASQAATPARGRIIASNTKLFTTAAVLARYGTGGRFSTGIYADGSLAEARSPATSTCAAAATRCSERQLRHHELRLGRDRRKARAGTRRAGIKKITGQIYGDETAFDARAAPAYSGYAPQQRHRRHARRPDRQQGLRRRSLQANPPVFAAQRLRVAIRQSGITVGIEDRRARRRAARRDSRRCVRCR